MSGASKNLKGGTVGSPVQVVPGVMDGNGWVAGGCWDD